MLDERDEELRLELQAMRGRIALAKCGDDSCEESLSQKRAKRVYKAAVLAAGGASAVAGPSGEDESTVRYRCEHPKRIVHASHVYDLPPRGMKLVIDDMLAALEEKLGGMRRAG